MTWVAVLVASVACLGLKIAGWSVPTRLLNGERLQRASLLVPVALLAGLVVVQSFAAGPALQVDARSAGLAAAAVALLLRAPFLVVVLAAAATAALIRLL